VGIRFVRLTCRFIGDEPPVFGITNGIMGC
jgi:hypothetical protein